MRRFLLSVIACVCVSIGMWAQGIFVADGNKVYVHATSAGQFAQNFNANSFNDGTTFVFGNDCVLNQADVNAILTCGQVKFYVDFFDVTNNGQMSASDIDPLITNAVNSMASNWQSQKGIILPYNSTLGTSMVVKPNGNEWSNQATFTEYAAYYRESDVAKNLVLYIFDDFYYIQNTTTYTYADTKPKSYYNKAVAQLNTHSDIIGNAETVLVSTITNAQFDLTQLTASMVEIEITHDDLIGGHGNPAIPDRASIYVKSEVAGGFASHISTAGTKNTPTDVLRITGPVSSSDIAAVSKFSAGGPRVLDLREAQTPTAADIAAITNSGIEYILLPYGWDKANVNLAANMANMPSLKAAISVSADNKNLVAYLGKAGSLAEARVLYTGAADGGAKSTVTVDGVSYDVFYPRKTGVLESVTLSGNLNGSDISANVTGQGWQINANGHLYEGDTPANNGASALNQEQVTIKSMDLSDAVFERQEDMCFSGAGLTYLTSVQLPTSNKMTFITRKCMENIQTLPELMIPSNFTEIKAYAFNLCTSLTHIYTNMSGNNGYDEDDNVYLNADAVDGGPNTYTIASTVTKIETGAFTTGAHPIMDVYVLARTTPLCERDAFQAGMYYGWGGLRGNFLYCREKYFNGDEAFTVLHFPNGISDTEKAKYTDLDRYNYYAKVDANRNNGYSQPDQTGALDGDGNPIVWPLFSETRRAYNQGISGYVWYDWTPVRDIDEHNWFEGQAKADAFGSNTILGLSGSEPDVSALSSEISVVSGATGDTFDNYIGWHQFVLCNAGYFYDPVPVDDDTEYEMYDKWYSFCIPYDITVEEAVELMGDPRNNTLPDVRTLMNVYRFPSKNKIYLNISKDLGGDITFDESGKWASGGTDVYIDEEFQGQYGHSESVSGLYTKEGKKILIKGGYPYLVKPWFPVGMTAPKNLGVYILSKRQFPQASVGHTETICAGTDAAMEDRAPFIHHTVQALNGDKDDNNAMNYGGKYDGTDNTKYFYTFVGHYTTQPLPKYCYYLSGGQFRRYVNFTETTLANWKWNPYVTIIGVTATTEAQITSNINDINYIVTGDKGYSYSDNYRIDLSSADDDRETTNAKYYFIFDDGMEDNLTGDDNETTAIELADGMVNAPVNNGKVYNMNGQFMGNSVNSLNKGLYIVNGKKFVVK
ncbi:MAG: leucine-rich repeat protein [Prevotella sp.]|nr:leucine-rich repeat protein [Prevotella sp.]